MIDTDGMMDRMVQTLMEKHGLQIALEVWKKQYPGLQVDDMLDEGIEYVPGRTQEVRWCNYDAFCDQHQLMNVTIEAVSTFEHYSVQLFVGRDSSEPAVEMEFDWSATYTWYLEQLNK